jgi:hypothetical protein
MILVLDGDMIRRYRERSGQINRPIGPVRLPFGALSDMSP